MSAPQDLDRRLDDWLQDGPGRAPERSIAAALEHAATHPRRRDPLAVLRRDPMGADGFGFGVAPRLGAMVAALGLLLVAALAVATVGGLWPRQPAVVPPLPSTSPTPSVAPSPTASPTTAPSPVPSASPATSRVDLVDDIGGHAFVEITDQSGTLVTARAGQPSEAGPASGDIGASNLAGDPKSIVLSWVGCPSDTPHVLTIAADGRTMTLDQPVCQGDTLGVDRVLVLTFDGPVPAGNVTASITHSGG